MPADAPEQGNKSQSRRERYEILRGQLDLERSSFISHWREIGDYILPRRPRFNTSDNNRGDKRNSKIIDSTGTLAARTLSSGMMGGVTSPARPWFRLTTPDPSLSEFGPVKTWLHQVSNRMASVFLRSNVYNALPILYKDLGTFGTGTMVVEEDFDKVIHCYPIPVGSYYLANDAKLRCRVFVRELTFTVRQVVMKFGMRDEKTGAYSFKNISTHVKGLWDNGQYETSVNVRHIVHPNEMYSPNKLGAQYKKYASCYYEVGGDMKNTSSASYMESEQTKLLRESGYDYFPPLAGRWETTGEDVYGTSCPGMDALGDVKSLQLGEKRIYQAAELKLRPPMVGPSSLRTAKASILPGDITYLDEREGQKGFRPAYQVDFSTREMEEKQAQTRQRIQRAFYEDLFLMLSQSDRREITAREIDERHEEKLLALGPVLEQLNQDILDPLIDNTFYFMMEQGQIPEPPEEIAGVNLKVEYISIMAQAQKLLGVASMDRFAGFTGNLIKLSGDPGVAMKVDFDQLIDEYGDATSVPPGIIRSDEVVAQMRAQQAKAQQAAQQMEQLTAGVGAAKDLAAADMSGDNALTRLMKRGQAGSAVPQQ